MVTRSPTQPTCTPLSEGAVLLRWPELPSAVAQQTVRRLAQALERLRPPELLEWVPGLLDLALLYDPRHTAVSDLAPLLERLLEPPPHDISSAQREGVLHRLPVCYHPEVAPDLLELAAALKLRPEALVELHAGAVFEVVLLGFAPGFAYLEAPGWPLEVPRRAVPRPRLPAGSVGLAGRQSAVYPHASAGGWRLIGRCPVRLFDVAQDPPARLALGDRVRFEPISLEAFGPLSGEGR